MRKQKPVGLVAAGRISQSFLQRLPNLVDRLGPVMSTSLRLASRISNLLKAGRPVSDWMEFESCGTIVISAARPGVFVTQLLSSGLDWKGKVVLLCDAAVGSESLEELKSAGVSVGSLAAVDGTSEKLYVAEGCSAAVREARELVESGGARLLRIHAAQKPLYTAGVCFATSLALPLIAASAEALKASGLDSHQATEVAELLFSRTLRTYRKAGRKGWNGPIPRKEIESIRHQAQALLAVSPPLANYYFENAALTLRMFKQNARWLEDVATQVGGRARAAGAA